MQVIIEIVFADMPVRLGINALDLGPIALQFLADHHRIGSQNALPQIRLIDADQHAVIGADDDPGIDFNAAFHRWQPRACIDDVSRGRGFSGEQIGHMQRQSHSAANRSRGDEKLSAIDFRRHMFLLSLWPSELPLCGCHCGFPHRCRSGRYWSSHGRYRHRSDGDCA